MESFERLYNEYSTDIYKYVYYKTGNKWDAEDVVSDTFRKAFVNFPGLRNDQNVRSWLMTIARNTLIDHFRRRKNFVSLEDAGEFLMVPDSILMQLEREFDNERLKFALNRLPEDERVIVNLKYLQGLKYREIGDMIGKSEETAKMKSYRALRKLRKWLGGLDINSDRIALAN
ncbi:RNA polymerase sigma factor [Cohnella lupini]|uniref:RNA polymerase sigma-70 factor (ECF subfamily) n=1 Tax=Cohnella lupini TaxID=1294267 RepID=A0A3D9IEU1_9BACL|nr:RNA polymerase sigma factor [Cohnella lupini]RED60304.1 RNA polymerase sigma-70 factor (ECF subfamily) [Cohnella lupini]